MKQLTLIALTGLVTFLFLFDNCTNPNSGNEDAINVIPKPFKVEAGNGSFTIQTHTKILVAADRKEAREIAEYFASRLSTTAGIDLIIENIASAGEADNAILLTSHAANLGDEGYLLDVNPNSVVIKAPKPAGLFYGVQTLLQLLPPEIYGCEKSDKEISWSIPAVQIIDKPRYGWRGMHLDVVRHFFSKEDVKRYIDMLAMHKMNILHLHLVDDQGWRVEIKKYPKLVEIGSRRADFPWNDWQGKETSGAPVYSGFYTQEDIKEIVAYAQSRFITVLPEIEMPGHTLAALAAYPEYSCTGGPFIVPSGGVDIWTNHTYCIGNEKTYEFLEDVLSEIIDLFPSKYIHIGGDETTRIRWEACAKCQARIQKEGLGNEDGLYGYFINRIGRFLASRDRILIGWDEILEGGENVQGAIMSWRGTDRCTKAAGRGHDVVVAPSSHLYFGEEAENEEPRLPLEKVYSFETVPVSLAAEASKHILGAQACVWTEHVFTMKQVEEITLPRLAALAEVVWSADKQRDFDNFFSRLTHQYPRYDAMQLNYRQPDLQGGFNGEHVFTDSVLVKIMAPGLHSEVRYTLDESEPTLQSTRYTQPFYLKNSAVLKAREFLPDGGKGRIRTGFYEKQEPLAAVEVENVAPGLLYQYVEGKYEHTSDVPLQEFQEKGVVNHFMLPPNHIKHYFGVIYSGLMRIPDAGIYTFYCETNDGSQLYIGNKLVVDHGEMHPAEEKAGSIALQAGLHPIRVIYFQNAGASFLKISYSGGKIEKQEIPESVLFYKK